jgi:hypothetical protein
MAHFSSVADQKWQDGFEADAKNAHKHMKSACPQGQRIKNSGLAMLNTG